AFFGGFSTSRTTPSARKDQRSAFFPGLTSRKDRGRPDLRSIVEIDQSSTIGEPRSFAWESDRTETVSLDTVRVMTRSPVKMTGFEVLWGSGDQAPNGTAERAACVPAGAVAPRAAAGSAAGSRSIEGGASPAKAGIGERRPMEMERTRSAANKATSAASD